MPRPRGFRCSFRFGCLEAKNYAEGSKRAPWSGQPARRECAEVGLDEITPGWRFLVAQENAVRPSILLTCFDFL